MKENNVFEIQTNIIEITYESCSLLGCIFEYRKVVSNVEYFFNKCLYKRK